MNTFLMDQVMATIEADPDSHNQSVFGRKTDCGTTLCFAGHTVVLAGGEINWNEYKRIDGSVNITACAVTMPDGHTESIETAATSLLGLAPTEANALFFYFPKDNVVESLKVRVKEIQNGEWL